MEYAEEQAYRAEGAAEAAAEAELDDWTENALALIAHHDALLAHTAEIEAEGARERAEILARAAEAAYWSRQPANHPFG